MWAQTSAKEGVVNRFTLTCLFQTQMALEHNQNLDFQPNQRVENYSFRDRHIEKEIHPQMRFTSKTSLERIESYVKENTMTQVEVPFWLTAAQQLDWRWPFLCAVSPIAFPQSFFAVDFSNPSFLHTFDLFSASEVEAATTIHLMSPFRTSTSGLPRNCSKRASMITFRITWPSSSNCWIPPEFYWF